MQASDEPAVDLSTPFTCREGEGVAADEFDLRVIAIADGHVRLRFSGADNSRIVRAGNEFVFGPATYRVDAFGRDGCRNVVLRVQAAPTVRLRKLGRLPEQAVSCAVAETPLS